MKPLEKVADGSKYLVPVEHYDQLAERASWLSCLEAAGVDSWQGCEEAQRIREEEEG